MLCCCGGGGLLGFLGFRRGAEVDKEAKLFATPAVTAIGKDWSKEAMQKYAAPSFAPLLEQGQPDKYLVAWRKKLGSLRRLGEFTTKGLYFGSKNGLPPATRVSMTASATFEKGEGTVVVGVAKTDGKWGVENLDIQSDALLK